MQMHRRKSSRESADSEPETSPPSPPIINLNDSPTRPRVVSTPISPASPPSPSPSPISNGRSYLAAPPSAGPHRTTFATSGVGISSSSSMPNGGSIGNGHPSSPFRSSFSFGGTSPGGHARTMSASMPFLPSTSSPLASSFPLPSDSTPSVPTTNSKEGRRHSRIHSRNLSVFFPRPGVAQSTIAEDGSQELVLGGEGDIEAPSPVSVDPPLPSGGSGRRGQRHSRTYSNTAQQLSSFSFGGRPPPSSSALSSSSVAFPGSEATENEFPETPGSVPSSAGGRTRRGHHHKHSMSHQFFSFLEPGSTVPSITDEKDLHTQPTPMPRSPWAPISPFPESAAPTSAGTNDSFSSQQTSALQQQHLRSPAEPGIAPLLGASLQFALGAVLWAKAQRAGALAATALGYWVVFDAFGIAIKGRVWEGWPFVRERPSSFATEEGEKGRFKSFANSRLPTLLLFAQSVYLLFAAVYVLKESFEHLLLSSDSSESPHHHHRADEHSSPATLQWGGEEVEWSGSPAGWDPAGVAGGGLIGWGGAEWPLGVVFLTVVGIVVSGMWGTHERLTDICGNRLPAIPFFLRPSAYAERDREQHQDRSVLRNPYAVLPIAGALAVILGGIFADDDTASSLDLVLSLLLSLGTFRLSTQACILLGSVLLQTAPSRSAKIGSIAEREGRMERFLRCMKEIERHPTVVHLPAPHIWMLRAPSVSSSISGSASAGGDTEGEVDLVVTIELHVRSNAGDEEVLGLTKWAAERCTSSLQGKGPEGGKAEVTVGVVRG